MSVTGASGAWLAATAGALTGALERRLRPAPQQRSVALGMAADAGIAALAYGMFVVAGLGGRRRGSARGGT